MVVPVVRGASAILLALIPAMAGCSFDASFDGTRYRCGEGDTCPSGYTCVAEECVVPGGPDVDAAIDVDANANADAAVDNDASTASTDAGTDAGIDATPVVRFSDNFDDGVLLNWAAWEHPGCTTTETGGYLQLSYSGTGDAYCGADTNQAFDLRTGSVSVEIVEAPLANNFESYLILFDATQQIHFIKSTDGLRMELKIGANVMGALTIPNDSTIRFWRIRTQGATTIWETSANGTTWTQRHSTTIAINVSAMKVELAAGHYAPGPGSAVRSRFDRLTVE